MNVDTKLYESINNNSNLTKNQKELLYNCLMQVKINIFDPYIPDFNFDNVLDLIKNLKILPQDENEIIRYDKSTNTLILGRSPVNQEFNTYKSLINLICQSYDEQDKKYNSGLTITIDGVEYGTKLNNLLVDYLITINTGLFNKEDSDGE